MTTNIYVLKLNAGRYYVGKTSDVKKRYTEHVEGSASAWTRKYKPICIEKIINTDYIFQEDKTTKEYMSRYGVNMVRGESYIEIEFSEFQEQFLNHEIN